MGKDQTYVHLVKITNNINKIMYLVCGTPLVTDFWQYYNNFRISRLVFQQLTRQSVAKRYIDTTRC